MRYLMAEHGSFKERWQYRQEMKAYGAWSRWGLPTRDDFAQFMMRATVST